MEDFMCNVLIMGKTGTGKSSLLNYICDSTIAQTGTGKPVTGEGIYDYVVKINNQDVRIFDSWGIEAGKVERWKELIKKSLNDHGTQKSIQDWFHSIIYCVQAGGGRVEDIDVEIIKQFLNEGYKLTIVLTKADQVSEDDEVKMKETIIAEICGKAGDLSNNLSIIATCAEKKVTRSGETNPFGKEDVCMAILTGWRDTVLQRLPKHVVARVVDEIRSKTEAIKHDVYNQVSGIAEDNVPLYNNIQDQIKAITEYINNKYLPKILQDIAQSCHKANMSLHAMLHVSVETEKIEVADKKKTAWLTIIPSALVPVSPMIALVTTGLMAILKGTQHLIKVSNAKNEDNIQEQRVALYQMIDDMTEKMIHQYESQESTIAAQLKQYL